MKKLFPLIVLLLLCVSARAQDFKGGLFDKGTPQPSPTPVEIASRNEAFTKRLAADAFHNPLYAQMYSSFASSFVSSTFAGLGTPADGSVRYCSDCQATSPCTGSGSGATASRVNGAWNCSTGGSGGGGSGISGLTTGTIPKAASATTLTDSPLSVSGSNVTVAANILPDGVATRDVGSRTNPYATLHVRTAVEFNAATGDNNYFSYSDQIGPLFHDDNVGANLIFNLQGLVGSKTFTPPNANITIAGANSTTNTVPVLSSTAGVYSDSSITVVSNNVGVGLGSVTPPTMLTVGDTTSSSPRGLMSWQSSTDTNGARLGFRKNRGPFNAPTTIISGDTIGRLVAWPYDGTGWLEMGSIAFESTGTIATNRTPTQIVFKTATDAAPSVLTTALTLGPDQSATFAGSVKIGAGAAITSSGAGGALGSNAFTSTAYATANSATNRLARLTSANTYGDSLLSDDATNVTLASGQFLAPNGSAANPSYSFTGSANYGLSKTSNCTSLFAAGTDVVDVCTSARTFLNGNLTLGSTNTITLEADAANVFALRNGANAQRFNIGNTFTSASVREDLSLYFSSNVAHVGATTTGATARVMQLDFGGSTTAALSVPATVTGTNTAGGTLTASGGLGTGNAAPGRVSIQTGALSATSGTTTQTAVDRYVVGASKVLTNNSATTIVNVTDASNTVAAGQLSYAVEVFDGTDLQVEEGTVSFHIINKGGVFSGNTVVKAVNQQAVSAGTLTVTFAISAANPALLSVNANTSLTPSTGYPRITYSIFNGGQQAVAVQ